MSEEYCRECEESPGGECYLHAQIDAWKEMAGMLSGDLVWLTSRGDVEMLMGESDRAKEIWDTLAAYDKLKGAK